MIKKILIGGFIVLACVGLIGCQPTIRGEDALLVGAMSGPESDLIRAAIEAAKTDGLTVELVEFEDYMTPNVALAEKNIDANVFQHLPYLNAMKTQSGYALEPIARTFIFPMGIYSSKHKTPTVPDGATIAIPNDPSNAARALLLLHSARLITLRDPNNFLATPAEIIDNPHHLKIQQLDAAQLPRVLEEVDFAAINTTFAIQADLRPSRDAVWRESSDSPYANLLVIRAEDRDMPKYEKFVKALHSEAVLSRAKALFGEEAIKAW